MIKKSVVLACDYTSSYDGNNSVIFFHTLLLANGDSGNVGTSEMYPDKILAGRDIYYTMKGNTINLRRKSDYEAQ